MVGGPKDLAWIHPKGREMDGEDWNDTLLHVIGMFVSGDPIRDPGPRGEQQHDSSFLLWLNGSPVDCEVTLPENEWVQHGAVVLSTDPDNPIGTEAHAGGKLVIGPRSLVLLQET
jgi:glycogen operon protein